MTDFSGTQNMETNWGPKRHCIPTKSMGPMLFCTIFSFTQDTLLLCTGFERLKGVVHF